MKSKLVKRISVSSLLIACAPLTANAFTVDLRGGYLSGSHTYETRIKVSNAWENGWAASLETNTRNPTNRGNRLIALSNNEMEINRTIPLDGKWSFRPGVITQITSSGTRIGPYLRLSYSPVQNLSLGVRYRYDYYAFTPVNPLTGKPSRNDQHRWDGYLTYKINEKWTVAWQTSLYHRVDSQRRYGNNKRWATENAFVLLYKLTPTITPYIEYDYLDRQGSYQGRGNIHENSYRLGVAFTF